MPPVRSRRAGATPDRPCSLGLVAALALHGAIVAVLVSVPPPPALPPLHERSIEVEIVAARPAAPAPPMGEPSAPVPDRVPAAPATAAARPAPEPEATPEPPPLIQAKRLMAGATLAKRLNRQALEALPTLAPDERLEQLCGIEAMEQVHAWDGRFQPDRLIAYAMAGTKLAGNMLLADGAAFRSRRQWYNLKFRCEVAADGRTISAFAFLVGDPVPRSLWAAHDLPPVH